MQDTLEVVPVSDRMSPFLSVTTLKTARCSASARAISKAQRHRCEGGQKNEASTQLICVQPGLRDTAAKIINR